MPENRIAIYSDLRVEVIGKWRRPHNEELHDLYCSPDIIRAIEWRRMRGSGACSTCRETKVA